MQKNTSLLLFTFFIMNLHAQLPFFPSGVYAWDKQTVKKSEDREVRQLMEGQTTHFEYLEIHATTQYKGAKPRPPHVQKDLEELILVKEGTMKFTMDDQVAIVGPGSAILIPPFAMQALENIGNGPLTYYVLMFRSKKPMDMARSISSGGSLFVNADDVKINSSDKGHIDYFCRPTAMCEKMELKTILSNISTINKGIEKNEASQIIILIDGILEVSIEGRPYRGKAGDLFLINSNERHAIKNTGDHPSSYFELKWK